MKSRLLGLVIALILLGDVVEMRAQYTWTGTAGDGNVQNPSNWQGGNAPTGSGLEDLIFNAGGVHILNLPTDASFRDITIGASNAYYGFNGSGQLTLTGNVTTAPDVFSSIYFHGPLVLAAGTHTVSLGNSGLSGSSIFLYGSISGTGSLAKYGAGTLIVDGSNTFSGYVDLQVGATIIHGGGPLGTGLIKMNGGTLIAADYYPDSHTTTLTNNLSLGYNSVFGEYGNTGSIVIQGSTTIGPDTAWVFLYTYGLGQLTLGDLGETNEGSGLSFAGGGFVRLTGANTYSGNTEIGDGTTVVFTGAPPDIGTLAVFGRSYAGTEVPTNLQADWIDRFYVESTSGIIGFDSPDLESPQTFSEAIDLSNLNWSVRIGTSTSAILTGEITPAGPAYRFGGRGTLVVASNLTNELNLTADSGIHLFLTGTDDYFGYTEASAGAAIVFDSASALQEYSELRAEYDGYIGQTEATGLSSADFLSCFDLSATYGVVGFDAANALAGRTVSDEIDLTGFHNSVFIGTSTNVTLAGPITPQGADYQFTGFRDGQLVVASILSGNHNMIIGLDGESIDNPAPFGVVFRPTVTLTAANSFTGDTYIQSGLLILGNAAALSNGWLFVNSYTDDVGLRTSVDALTIPNRIDFAYYGGFTLGGDNDFTLSGDLISYNAWVKKIDINTVTLSGNNSGLAADLSILSGTVEFASDHAAGTGTLELRNFDGENDGQAVFTSSAPSMGNLAGESLTKVDVGPGTLTIHQTSARTFSGQIIGAGGLTKAGGGELYLTGTSTYAGTTTVSSGTLVVQGGSITQGAATVNVGFADGDNGTLRIIAGGTVANQQSNVGYASGSRGSVLVDGTGSTWQNSGNLTVGVSGSGQLTVSHGADVTSFDGVIGISNSGTVTVTNPGSSWTTTEAVTVGGFGIVGVGYLYVTNGGVVSSGRGSVGYIGNGNAMVDGPTSVWNNNAGSLLVGEGGGNGFLTLQGGGTAISQSGKVGIDASFGSAIIRGAGSAWTVATDLEVGTNLGTGVLQVIDLGAVNLGGGTGTLTLGVNAGSHGALIIGDGEDGPIGGIVNAASITSGGAHGEIVFETGTTRAAPYYLTKDGTAGGAPVQITGTLMVTNNHGYNVLSGTNTYSGGTTIYGGTLVAGSNAALGTGTIYLDGGLLSVAPGVTLNNPLDLSFGGLLGGNGTIGSPVTVSSGVVVAPGDSPGTLTFASGLTFAPGGSYDWQLQTVAGGAGTSTGWDLISISSGTLGLNTLTTGSFTVRLISLNSGGLAGFVSDFNPALPYTFTIATAAGGIVGFNASNFTIDASGFLNFPDASHFGLSVSGNNLNLNFTPVPEPSIFVLLALGLGAGGLACRRRRR